MYQGLVRLTKDVTNPAGDSNLFVPDGAVCAIVDDENDYLIVETQFGEAQFPVTDDEFVLLITEEEVEALDVQAEEYTAAYIRKYEGRLDEATVNAIHRSHLVHLINGKIKPFRI